jgi:hypothetical protein
VLLGRTTGRCPAQLIVEKKEKEIASSAAKWALP